MTAKEKAEELVLKYYELAKNKYPSTNGIPLAKQCALIAVNEIMQSDPIMPIDLDCSSKSSLKYWREVKQEIENLKTK